VLSRYCLFVAQGLALAAVVALPWVYCGWLMPGRVAAIVAALLALVLVGARVVAVGFSWRSIRAPLLLMACAVGLGAWQLTTAAADLSPSAKSLKSEFAALPDTPAPATPLSFYVPGTRRQIAALICAVAAMALGAALFSETKAMLLLMSVVAGSAFIVAGAGLLQRAAGFKHADGRQAAPYLPSPLPSNAAPFGPFINRNSAGGLLELGLAAAAGLAVWRISRMPRRTGHTSAIARLQWFLIHIDLPLLLALGALTTIAGAIFASLSRGAMLAAIIGAVGALVVSGNRTRRGAFFWLAAGVGAAAAALGVWLVQSSALEARWASVLAGDILKESRWLLWRESLRAAAVVQPFGAGLGAFYYAHAPFEQQHSLALFRNADNQYIETLVVGGVCGALILLALCFLIIRAVIRLWRKAQSPEHLGLAAGATALVTMQLVHACFDFAWYLSPIMFPLALWCGAIFRKANLKRSIQRTKEESGWLPTTASVPEDAQRSSLRWGLGVIAILVPGICWAGYESSRSAIVERIEFDTRNRDGVERSTAEIDRMIELQKRAAAVYPDDGEVQVRLAELWSERYSSEVRAEIDRDPMMRVESERYLPLQYPAALNAAANLRSRVGDEAGIDVIRSLPVVQANLMPSLAAAREARRLCPFSPFAQTLNAQLCFLDGPASNDVWYLERAERLSQGRPDWLYMIGQLHLNGARPDRAWTAWKRSWTMASADEDAMMRQAASYLNPEEILEKIVPNDPRKIVELADKYYSGPDFVGAHRAYYAKAKFLLDAGNLRTSADEHVRGIALLDEGKLDAAEDHLIAATRAFDARPEWFLDLAAVQAAQGRRDDATASARRSGSADIGADREKKYLSKAADLLRSLPQADPRTRRRSAALFLEIGDNARAAETAREVVAADPSDIDARLILAKAMLAAGDVAAALEEAERMESAAPQRDDVRDFHETVKAARKAEPAGS
jgi:tetratricopeptide (TPR) repeat protein